jgi:hypothetical protein
MFISIALFVIAIALIGYAAAAFGGVEKVGAGDYQTPFKFEQDSVAFALCVVGGVFSLILSIMGCLTVKFKNPLVTTPFVICSFIIAILCMAVGGVVMSADVRQQACFTKFNLKDGKETTGNELAKEYMQFIDKSMCSKICPCTAAQKPTWLQAAPEADLKKYERTWTASNQATPFKTTGTLVPM